MSVSDEENESVVVTEEMLQEEALELRAGLEELFERVRVQSRSLEEQVTSTQEQFLLLVSQYSKEALSRAVLLTARHTDYTGRLPIHLACEYSAGPQVIRYLLDADEKKQSILSKDKWGDLPIHIACSRRNYVEVVKLLLDSDATKQTIFVKDNHESMPLHMACRYSAPPAVFRLLLESDTHKKTLFEEGIHGQYPIHVACRSDAPPEVIRLLLESDEQHQSVLKQDDGGRLPIHVYLVRFKNLQVIQLLLEAMFCKRMERLGLQKWKQNVKTLLKSMSTHERDFMTRELLDILCEVLKETVERVVLLELAVWKASCLSNGDFQTMEDIDLLGATDETFNPSQYKHKQHIKSGADIIVPGVLPYLEDEPVTEALKKIKEVYSELIVGHIHKR